MAVSVRANIENFLSYRRLAMVGVSRNAKDFSRTLFRELNSRGYDMVPVNPAVDEVEGVKCFGRVSEIEPAVQGALLMVPSRLSADVVKDCAAAGISQIWFYRGGGEGAVSPQALQTCEEYNISTIPGECPYMYLAGGAWYHGVHRFCRKIVGTLPQ